MFFTAALKRFGWRSDTLLARSLARLRSSRPIRESTSIDVQPSRPVNVVLVSLLLLSSENSCFVVGCEVSSDTPPSTSTTDKSQLCCQTQGVRSRQKLNEMSCHDLRDKSEFPIRFPPRNCSFQIINKQLRLTMPDSSSSIRPSMISSSVELIAGSVPL